MSAAALKLMQGISKDMAYSIQALAWKLTDLEEFLLMFIPENTINCAYS
jgi:hypothetical protein